MLLSVNWDFVSAEFMELFGSSESATVALIQVSKITIKILLMLLIICFAVLLALTATLFVIYGLWALIHTFFSSEQEDARNLKGILQSKAEKFIALLNTPIFIVIIVCGILAIFGIVPVVTGNQSDSLVECWKSGVMTIATIVNKEEHDFGQALSLYLLIYIAVLGMGFAVANILFEIIKEIFERKNKRSFLGEYSNSIGLLAVGISILLTISSNGLDEITNPKASMLEIIISFFKPFFLVVVVIALGVITLEIVRLLMDLRENLIRREARYVFVMLVGQCTMVIIKAFWLIYNALSSALGENNIQPESVDQHMKNTHEQILGKIGQDMKKEIDKPDQTDNNIKIPYSFFEKKITRK